jgi:small subunit ribosomal protein S24e
MKIEIKSEKNNPLLKRKELLIEAVHENEPTPSRAALQELVTKQFGYEPEKTDVRSIYTDGGSCCSQVKVFVWAEKIPVRVKKEKKKAKK